MYRIVICDDEKSICAEMETQLTAIAQESKIPIEIKIWNSGTELYQYLSRGNKMDLIFLDIEFMDSNGIELAHYVREDLNDFQTAIVYISHEQNYAMQLFQTQPFDFLVKPIKKSAVKKVMECFVRQCSGKDRMFEYQKGQKYYKIYYHDIIYFQSMNRKIIMKTAKEEEEFYGKLKDVAGIVPRNFLQIHKSYLINQNYVREYRYQSIILQNGQELNISKPYRNEVQTQLSMMVRE